MLGWLFPKCPVGTREKVWVERRTLWLVERFGFDRLKNATVVLPTVEYFPEPYEGDEVSARNCFERICRYMQIDSNSVTFEIVDDELMPGAAGLYEQRLKSNIIVSRSQLGQPPRLLATIAHELAHEMLLKGGHLTGDTEDHEFVTDLLPVFLGLGIFTANATLVTQQWTEGQMAYSSYSKQGYLSSIVLGYALAAFAYLRDEPRPAWAEHLRTDARLALANGLHHLRRTGDTLLMRERDGAHPRTRTTDDLKLDLGDRSATRRLDALWEIIENPRPPAELLDLVMVCLRDRDADVQQEAIRALGHFGEEARNAIPLLIQAAWAGTSEARIAAASTLGALGRSNAEEIVPELAKLTKDPDPDIVASAATGLARLGAQTGAAVPHLLEATEAWASVGEVHPVDQLLVALLASTSDARQVLEKHFAARDPDVRRFALGILRDLGG